MLEYSSIISQLLCPYDKKTLLHEQENLVCRDCRRVFPYERNIMHVISESDNRPVSGIALVKDYAKHSPERLNAAN